MCRFTSLFLIQMLKESMLCQTRFQQLRDVRWHQFLFSAKEGAEGNSLHFDRNMKENFPQRLLPSRNWKPCLYVVILPPLFPFALDETKQCLTRVLLIKLKTNLRRHQLLAKSISEQVGISCERGGAFIHEGEPANSPETTAQFMLLSTKFPLVLLFQVNEQQKVKSVRVSGTDSTVMCGLVAVQIFGENFSV